MIARLRALRDRPFDPLIVRSVVVIAGAVCLGPAVLVGMGLFTPRASGPPRPASPRPSAAWPARTARPSVGGRPTPARLPRSDRAVQDPQDHPGTPAAARARRELASHRALQHLPFHRAGLSIALVGAEGSKAILEVRAATVAAARSGYRRFLRREHDDGRAYRPQFRFLDRRFDRGLAPGSARCRAIPHGDRDSGAADLPRSLRHEKEGH